MTVQIHSTVRMNCSVLYDPKYGLDITWKKDNVEVQLGGRFSLTDQNQLVIEDVAFNDAGKSSFFLHNNPVLPPTPYPVALRHKV